MERQNFAHIPQLANALQTFHYRGHRSSHDLVMQPKAYYSHSQGTIWFTQAIKPTSARTGEPVARPYIRVGFRRALNGILILLGVLGGKYFHDLLALTEDTVNS